ncbi:hypothetical protein ACGFYE_39525 [Streptomyces zaomyceticus]|uniref:hypothetical protein n=1 Tax=Streptomyces zaomyceticus TaxID=68286 RepID=UPI0037237F8D
MADPQAILARFTAWERSRRAAGLGYVTTRRITEELDLIAPEALVLYRTLREGTPERCVAPCGAWRSTERRAAGVDVRHRGR